MASPRTKQQNKALHVYFKEVADLLNESGVPARVFLENLELDYTKEMIKDIWRKIAKKQYGKDGTSELTTKELQDIFEEFNRHLSQFGLHLPFPSFSTDYDEEFLRKNGIIN